MNSSTANSPALRPIKSPRSSGQSDGGQGTDTDAEEKEPQSAYGPQIAQTALQSVGLSTKNFGGLFTGHPEYALAVSVIFTKATEQAIMLGTAPRHVLSTSLLRNSLLHDKRFRQVPMSEAVPGDIILESGGRQADGYAGIVVDHKRIVSNGRQRVQNNSSLLEIQRNHQEIAIFRYIGVQRFPSYTLANAGYNPDEPRIPAGQAGGGQWTTGGAGEGVQGWNGQAGMAPSTTVLSGGNRWTPGEMAPDSQAVADYLGDVGEVWKGYGDTITETVSGLWNAIWHPINTAKGVAKGVTHIVKDPVGALKAIGRQIADDFTGGDPRKAGKLIGEVLIALAGTEVSAEKLASLLPKVRAAAADRAVIFTAEETGVLQKVMSGEESLAAKEQGLIKGGRAVTNYASADASGEGANFGSFPNINPTGSRTNCVNCAIATDATLAGRPASALQGDPWTLDVLEKEFGGTFQPVSGPNQIGGILSQSGNGTRGIVAGDSIGVGPGHIFNVINDNGTIEFVDGQKGIDGSLYFYNLQNFQLLLTYHGTP